MAVLNLKSIDDGVATLESYQDAKKKAPRYVVRIEGQGFSFSIGDAVNGVKVNVGEVFARLSVSDTVAELYDRFFPASQTESEV
ncbi:MAG: hypothetical protein AAB373_03515 [Patescibacteria group bacterium]